MSGAQELETGEVIRLCVDGTPDQVASHDNLEVWIEEGNEPLPDSPAVMLAGATCLACVRVEGCSDDAYFRVKRGKPSTEFDEVLLPTVLGAVLLTETEDGRRRAVPVAKSEADRPDDTRPFFDVDVGYESMPVALKKLEGQFDINEAIVTVLTRLDEMSGSMIGLTRAEIIQLTTLGPLGISKARGEYLFDGFLLPRLRRVAAEIGNSVLAVYGSRRQFRLAKPLQYRLRMARPDDKVELPVECTVRTEVDDAVAVASEVVMLDDDGVADYEASADPLSLDGTNGIGSEDTIADVPGEDEGEAGQEDEPDAPETPLFLCSPGLVLSKDRTLNIRRQEQILRRDFATLWGDIALELVFGEASSLINFRLVDGIRRRFGTAVSLRALVDELFDDMHLGIPKHEFEKLATQDFIKFLSVHVTRGRETKFGSNFVIRIDRNAYDRLAGMQLAYRR